MVAAMAFATRGCLNQRYPLPGQVLAINSYTPILFIWQGPIYLHIVKNHPFIDGNKRTGAMADFCFSEAEPLHLHCRRIAL